VGRTAAQAQSVAQSLILAAELYSLLLCMPTAGDEQSIQDGARRTYSFQLMSQAYDFTIHQNWAFEPHKNSLLQHILS